MRVSWQSLSRVVRERLLITACADGPSLRSQAFDLKPPILSLRSQACDSPPQTPAWRQFNTQFASSDGSEVAAGPSTCGDKVSTCITERLASRVKGLTTVFCVLLLTVLARTRRPAGFQKHFVARQKVFWWRQAHEFSRGRQKFDPAKGRNHIGDGGPRHQGAEGLRQPAGGPRFHRALSDGGGSACPSRRVPVWPPRNADDQGAAGSADGARGPAMRRRWSRA